MMAKRFREKNSGFSLSGRLTLAEPRRSVTSLINFSVSVDDRDHVGTDSSSTLYQQNLSVSYEKCS